MLACASIMTMASVEVIQFSCQDLYDGLNGNIPELDVNAIIYSLLALGIVLKLFLYFYCSWAQKLTGSDTLVALTEDHLNDVMSNLVAIISIVVASEVPILWWFDPAGAILISVVIIYRWYSVMSDQVKKMVGHTAPPEFIDQVEILASSHDPRLAVDCTRAYHFGARCTLHVVCCNRSCVSKSCHLACILF